MLMDLGHESPIEHASYTFAIEGVSRVLTHQLVRHRIASYSMQSQRYVKQSQFEYEIPPSIEEDQRAREIFIKAMESSQNAYNEITGILKEKYENSGDKNALKHAIEDARYVFPNAAHSKIIVTMNARSLMNFFEHRLCNRAQWEIRDLAMKMLKEVKKVSPLIFKHAGPPCINGPCPEGKLTCGLITSVRQTFKEL
jgi:thymidylate synthase (FAD)